MSPRTPLKLGLDLIVELSNYELSHGVMISRYRHSGVEQNKTPALAGVEGVDLVELIGIEPTTS